MLQHIEARAIPALPGLDWGLADTLAHHLNRDLATLADLAAAYKQAHWNVLGPGFAELHRLFDQFADETRAYLDLVAERAVAPWDGAISPPRSPTTVHAAWTG
jgi:starvation-inducible DNA-binding protein